MAGKSILRGGRTWTKQKQTCWWWLYLCFVWLPVGVWRSFLAAFSTSPRLGQDPTPFTPSFPSPIPPACLPHQAFSASPVLLPSFCNMRTAAVCCKTPGTSLTCSFGVPLLYLQVPCLLPVYLACVCICEQWRHAFRVAACVHCEQACEPAVQHVLPLHLSLCLPAVTQWHKPLLQPACLPLPPPYAPICATVAMLFLPVSPMYTYQHGRRPAFSQTLLHVCGWVLDPSLLRALTLPLPFICILA